MKYYLLAFKNYAKFNGRSNRPEYWYFVLFHIIFAIAAIVIDMSMGIGLGGTPYGVLYLLYVLATFIPGLAVSVRRLHDIDKSGWWILISLIPFIGSIWLIVLMASDGTKGPNKYGPDPRNPVTFDFETQKA